MVRQFVLQTGECIINWDNFISKRADITNWSKYLILKIGAASCFYKVGQELLQKGATLLLKKGATLLQSKAGIKM